jgi:hypothetical protein
MLPRTRALGAALAAALALSIAPAAHAATDQLSLVDSTESIGPGISLKHEKYLDSTGWYDEQVLTVDLADPVVKSDLLTAPTVAQGQPLSQQAAHAGAIAGVNGDFFDIDSTQASTGGEVQGGSLLKSADIGGWAHVGVSKTGIGQLVDLTLQATANINGTDTPVLSLNAADAAGVPANGLVAYTPIWGSGIRSRGVAGVADVAEALVTDGKVVQVNATVGSGAIPANSFYLVGRDSAATALQALHPGDPVSLTYGLKDSLAQQMQWAIGTNKPLVRNGVALAQGDTSVAPRTAIGFKDGGRTMFLLITDGRQTQVAGTTLAQTANMLIALGADTGLNLDGGGSTTLVAAAEGTGTATVRNTPSDGQERSDPTGIGLFVAPGDGKADKLILPTDQRVFPGLHRTLDVTAVDDHDTPVKPAGVTWDGATDGVVHAASGATDDLTVKATEGSVSTSAKVTMLHKLRDLELSSNQISFADAGAGLAQTLTVNGRDDQGYAAPIELQDMTLDYDHSLIQIDQTAAGRLKITPLKAGGTTLDVKVGDQDEKAAVTIGVVQQNVYTFNHGDEASRWSVNGTVAANQKLGLSSDGYLTLTYKAERNSGLSAKTPIAIPGAPLRVHLKLNSTAGLQYAYINFRGADGVNYGPLVSPIVAGDNDITFTFTAAVKFPVTLTSTQVIETNVANQKDGVVTYKSIDEDVAASVPAPGLDPLEPDALFSPDGRTDGKDDWHFGAISDVQFTAANPTLAKTGIAALERIRATHPDLIVLNGDVTDLGAAEDMTLARQTLEAGGCELIPLTSTIGTDSTPAPTADKTPCYYVPGNHESYRAAGQGDLAPFTAEFGQPYGTFDHDGTRFILLASSLGTIHGTAWAQMPMFKAALADAATNPKIKNVMVFAHHPVDDPDPSKASQLGDRTEVALIEKMLSDFRTGSDKGVAMVGSHAQIANVHRIEGVPYVVMPSSGKDPYGTPDRGGFTGWMDWHVDADATAGQQWLTDDVRAFAQSISLTAPDKLEVGDSGTVSGTIVQPEGVASGTRTVPLRFPMSVHWSGSDNLAVGGSLAAAEAAGKDAVLDPVTGSLTALHSGDVTVTVTSDSMREYTGPDSLAPITASKAIHLQVTHVSQDTPAGGDVPATLSLTLGAPASFGAFVPGVAKTYDASTTAIVTSTAGDATLSASSATLANGAFALASPLVITPDHSSWTGPVSNDAFAIGFKQTIGANDALRTGAYAANVTFTLSTTAP